MEYRHESIYGYYIRQKQLVDGRPWFKNDGKIIWWNDWWDDWNMGLSTDKGQHQSGIYLRSNERNY